MTYDAEPADNDETVQEPETNDNPTVEEEPTTEEPTSEEPTSEEPTTEEPIFEDPAFDEETQEPEATEETETETEIEPETETVVTTTWGTVTYEYDPNGNLIRTISPDSSALYTYNSRGQLTEAVVQTGINVTHERYTYDYAGNRISKTTDNEHTKYLLDTNGSLTQVIAELDLYGNVKAYYTRGDELISQDREGEISYYIYDGHGNVRFLTNASGHVTDSYDYDAFGNTTSRTGETENNYLYCGEQFDSTTGLYYLRARYMNPSTGTFISMDAYQGSVYDPASLHKYLYANANPVMYSDPSGYSVIKARFDYDKAIVALGIALIIDIYLIFSLHHAEYNNALNEIFRINYGNILGTIEAGGNVSETVAAGQISYAKKSTIIHSEVIEREKVKRKWQGMTIIYRSGTKTFRHLTPRPIDYTGLSFNLFPTNTPANNHMMATTMELVRITPALTARLDDPSTGHVSIIPKFPPLMTDWQSSYEKADTNPHGLTLSLFSITHQLW